MAGHQATEILGLTEFVESIAGGGGASVFELDGNGDIMPSLSVLSDAVFESDGNGDIMPKL
jgi:hypothetical protein